jgi:hypothetical protein
MICGHLVLDHEGRLLALEGDKDANRTVDKE